MTLTASFPSLRPPPCTNKFPCESPSKLQYGVLYTILGLACIGIGGTRYTLASMGADQFEDSNSVGIYFNWYFFVFYAATVLSTTLIIYVQDNVSWAVGFGICVVCNTVGVILFLSGKNFTEKPSLKEALLLALLELSLQQLEKGRFHQQTKSIIMISMTNLP
ncbi:putative ABC-type nitrate transporter [Helianthus annuus]|nr:putative ABC-type nitrate transporter [Helianthus annuus]